MNFIILSFDEFPFYRYFDFQHQIPGGVENNDENAISSNEIRKFEAQLINFPVRNSQSNEPDNNRIEYSNQNLIICLSMCDQNCVDINIMATHTYLTSVTITFFSPTDDNYSGRQLIDPISFCVFEHFRIEDSCAGHLPSLHKNHDNKNVADSFLTFPIA